MVDLGNKKEGLKSSEIKLPKILKYYNKSSFSFKLRVRVFFNICIAAIIALFILIISTLLIQLNTGSNTLSYPIIISEIILLVIFHLCLIILIKGFYRVSTSLFMIITNLCVWVVMFTSGNHLLTRLDTVVFILAIINIIPLFANKNKGVVLVYVIVNIFLLIFFIQLQKEHVNVDFAILVDYLMDTSVALIFSGVAAYQILRVNKMTLEKVEYDYQKRLKAEDALKQSEIFRKKVFESSNIPIVIMDSTKYKYIDLNEAAVKLYGYQSKDELIGKTPVDVSAPIQYDGEASEKKADFFISKSKSHGSVKFEWLHQRPNGEQWDAEVYLLSFAMGNQIFLQFSLIDITERKKAKRDLIDSDLRYRAIFENAQVGIYQTTASGEILQANPALLKMLEFDSIQDLSGRNLNNDEAFISKSREEFIHEIEQKGFVRDYETEWLKKNGETLIVRENARVVRDIDGKVKYYEGFVVDVTERKKTVKALKESEEKYREMAELLPVVVWETDLKANCTYTNQVGLQIHQYTYEDLVNGINVLDLIIPEQKQKAIENLKQVLEGNDSMGEEYVAVKKDGTRFPVRIYTTVVYSNNKPVGYRGVTVDITEAKRIEKELKESEEKYRTLMENMNDIVMMVDNDDRVLYVNKKFTEILGYPESEIIGEIGYKKLIDPDSQKVIIEANQSRTNQVISQYEITMKAKDGRYLDFLVSGAPVKNSEGEIIGSIGNLIDITERKKSEKELEKYRNHLEILVKERTEELATSNEELLSTNEELHMQREELEAVLLNLQNTQNQLIHSEKMASLGILASGIAHEINNPLNFIKGGAFGIEQYFDDNLASHKDEIAPLLDGINEGIDRAASIVASLNHYNRKNDHKTTECDINGIIDNCLVMLGNEIRNRIDINKSYTSNKYRLLGNEGKLHQAVLNILSNAVQAIKGKGTIEIKTIVSKSNLKIVIFDTGSGISKENLNKIYDPFFTTKEVGEGTGLGLSITYNIIEEHNGSIYTESEVGKGTTVMIELPLE